jgi:hypothetical protein
MLLFFAGLVAGIVLAVVAAVIVLRWPTSERTHAPVRYSAIGAGRAVDTGSDGKFPADWDGAIWSPPGSQRR